MTNKRKFDVVNRVVLYALGATLTALGAFSSYTLHAILEQTKDLNVRTIRLQTNDAATRTTVIAHAYAIKRVESKLDNVNESVLKQCERVRVLSKNSYEC